MGRILIDKGTMTTRRPSFAHLKMFLSANTIQDTDTPPAHGPAVCPHHNHPCETPIRSVFGSGGQR